MQREGKICFRFRGKNTSGGKPWVIDHQGVGVAIPLDRVGRVRHDCLEGFFVPVSRLGESVTVGQ